MFTHRHTNFLKFAQSLIVWFVTFTALEASETDRAVHFALYPHTIHV